MLHVGKHCMHVNATCMQTLYACSRYMYDCKSMYVKITYMWALQACKHCMPIDTTSM